MFFKNLKSFKRQNADNNIATSREVGVIVYRIAAVT
jgi:hypothetical protein